MSPEAIYHLVKLLEIDEQLHAPLVAVLPEHGLFCWWNGSRTYQIAEIESAVREARRGRCLPVLAIWEARDVRVAHAELVALASIRDVQEDLPWNDAGAYAWARETSSLGPVYLFPGGTLVDPESEGERT